MKKIKTNPVKLNLNTNFKPKTSLKDYTTKSLVKELIHRLGYEEEVINYIKSYSNEEIDYG